MVKKRSKKAIGKQNRQRGAQAERDVVNAVQKAGGVAERTSPLEATKARPKGDVRIKPSIEHKEWWNCQVKHEKGVPSYMYKHLEGHELLFMKQTGRIKGGLVCMSLEFFLENLL